MQKEEYPSHLPGSDDDQHLSVTQYPGTIAIPSAPSEELKEPPQSRLSIILWGNRRKRLTREATRAANLNQVQPEWYQAFFVLWVAFYVLSFNIGTISLWMVGGYLMLAGASFFVQYQRRDSSRIPLHPTPFSGWLQLISYFVVIIPPLFFQGYVWRLPVLASYCLLDLWLIESGGYNRDPPKPNKASPRSQLWYSIASLIALIGIMYIALTTMGTTWPFIAYCAIALTLIIWLRPKKDSSPPDMPPSSSV